VDASSGDAQRSFMARSRLLGALVLCPLIAACEPAALAVLGGGAGTILRYNLDGIAARTFTAPAPVVRTASLAAAERMGLSIAATDTIDTGEVIRARAPNRDIEIELEQITPQATRMRITARGGSLFYDNATAVELVQQTEKLLEAGLALKNGPAPAAAAGASLPARAF
jgi:hypothetical protein